MVGDSTWHILSEDAELDGPVNASVDPAFRHLMMELHTDTHVLNAFVFSAFDGALVTGAQMHEYGQARMDFDLPGADNDELRALEAPINRAIAEDVRLDITVREYREIEAGVHACAFPGRVGELALRDQLAVQDAEDDPHGRDNDPRPPRERDSASLDTVPSNLLNRGVHENGDASPQRDHDEHAECGLHGCVLHRGGRS